MPSEIAVPFRLDERGRIATVTNPDVQIRQHVLSLINTERGERVVYGDYGLPLSRLVFEPGDETVAVELGDMLKAGMAKWEPGVYLQGLSNDPAVNGDGYANVSVRYARTDAPDTTIPASNSNVAVIGTGGQVREVIRS